MTKKIFFTVLAIFGLCLCCSYSFATENNATLGNEIMKSIDKTGESIDNVMSSNVIEETGNDVREGVDDIGTGMSEGARRGANYITTQTTTEGTTDTNRTGFTMDTTTWMWIILVVASVIIIMAIWYYATNNS